MAGNARASGGHATPRVVGGYEIVKPLGRGAMGMVFHARQVGLDRVVALKVLAPEIARDRQFIERFQREARASALLNDLHIVQGIDVGKDEATGLWYFAMEYVDGPSLDKLLKKEGALEENRVLGIGRDVAKALACAERHKVVHRDIKPDNILIASDGTVKLADLGLAKRTNAEGDAGLTQAGSAVGTPLYMSPEQCRGQMDNLDIRTDIYGLGATLFHLLAGKPPYEGNAGPVIMTKHLSEPIPLLHRIDPRISEPTSRLIAKMMAKEPDKRVGSAKELVDQFEKLLDRTRTGGARAPAGAGTTGHKMPIRGGTTNLGTPVGAQSTVGPRRMARGASSGSLIAAALAALVLVGVAALVLRGGDEPRTPSRKLDTPREPVVEKTPEALAAVVSAESKTGKTDPEAKTAPAAPAPPLPDPPAAPQPATPEPSPQAKTAEPEKTQVQTPAKVEAPKPQPEEPKAPPKPQRLPVEEAYAILKDVYAEVEPLLKTGRLDDAREMLARARRDPKRVACAPDLDLDLLCVAGMRKIRESAVEELRKKAGQEVTLRKSGQKFTGTISIKPDLPGVTLAVKKGPELTLAPEQLDVEDVLAYAPLSKMKPGEVAAVQGVFQMAAGNVKEAKARLQAAAQHGLAEQVALLLYRLQVAEIGEAEAAAGKVWQAAEACFQAKSLKEAEAAYLALKKDHAETEFVKQREDELKARLEAIAFANKPKFSFREKESMALFDPGFKSGPFPPMDKPDPLGPFEGKPTYFNQKTGGEVVYEIHAPEALSRLRWKGGAMQRMMVVVEDMAGKAIKEFGPINGGNVWHEENFEFPPQRHFVLRIKNQISSWYFIQNLEFK
ncbi:MAG: serine/threonine protein kinase [Planctomycetota bacterium]|nr:serine/threonine protein kinase [Planctomycetota bacterium]